MRVLIDLISTKNAAYDMSYYSKLQGFVYKLIINSPFSVLHNKKGYKFFCFSNIFPIGSFREGDKRHLLISSPNPDFIRVVCEQLSIIKEENKEIHIGELSFLIESFKIFDVKLNNSAKVITATPIIIRIPKTNYEKYGIKSDKEYVYWQPNYSFEPFLKQLEDNMLKKYKEFYKEEVKTNIFEMFRFIKPTVNHVFINGTEVKLFGTLWEFNFTNLNHDQKRKKVLQFAIDTGFGERNSLGFGFVNVVK
jgi:CRISPR-associated endoribonuclease Cas6